MQQKKLRIRVEKQSECWSKVKKDKYHQYEWDKYNRK